MDLKKAFLKIEDGQKQILLLLDGLKSPSKKSQEVYTLDDLSKLFKVTKRTIYNWKDLGILPFVAVGSKTYVTEKQLQEFLANHEIKSKFSGRVTK